MIFDLNTDVIDLITNKREDNPGEICIAITQVAMVVN